MSLISSGDIGAVVPPSQFELASDEFFPSIQHSSDDAYLVESGEHVTGTSDSSDVAAIGAWAKPFTNKVDTIDSQNEEKFPDLLPGHVVLRRGEPMHNGPSFVDVLKAPQPPRQNNTATTTGKKKNKKTVLVLGGGR